MIASLATNVLCHGIPPVGGLPAPKYGRGIVSFDPEAVVISVAPNPAPSLPAPGRRQWRAAGRSRQVGFRVLYCF
jgi:hypothetical protein